MKKLLYISVMLIPFIVVALFSACSSKDAGSVYYVKATLDGTTYEWQYGFTDIEPNAFGSYYPSVPGTEIFAQPAVIASTAPEADNYVYFFILSSSTSPASYSISDFDTEGAFYTINGTYWDFTVITFEITKYDAVGGTIEGTFSGSLLEWLGSDTKTVTNGQFKVIQQDR